MLRKKILLIVITLCLTLSVSCTKTVTKIQYVSESECGELLQAKHDSLVISKEIMQRLVDSNKKLKEHIE